MILNLWNRLKEDFLLLDVEMKIGFQLLNFQNRLYLQNFCQFGTFLKLFWRIQYSWNRWSYFSARILITPKNERKMEVNGRKHGITNHSSILCRLYLILSKNLILKIMEFNLCSNLGILAISNTNCSGLPNCSNLVSSPTLIPPLSTKSLIWATSSLDGRKFKNCRRRDSEMSSTSAWNIAIRISLKESLIRESIIAKNKEEFGDRRKGLWMMEQVDLFLSWFSLWNPYQCCFLFWHLKK